MSTTPRTLGTLAVVVLKARNLPNKSIWKQDPYCVVRFEGAGKRTKVDERGGQHPVWDHEIHFQVYDNKEPRRILKLSCFSVEHKVDDLIGEAELDVTDVLQTGEFDDWVQLSHESRYAGEVYLELTFYSAAPPLARRASKLSPSDRLWRPPATPPKSSPSRSPGHLAPPLPSVEPAPVPAPNPVQSIVDNFFRRPEPAKSASQRPPEVGLPSAPERQVTPRPAPAPVPEAARQVSPQRQPPAERRQASPQRQGRPAERGLPPGPERQVSPPKSIAKPVAEPSAAAAVSPPAGGGIVYVKPKPVDDFLAAGPSASLAPPQPIRSLPTILRPGGHPRGPSGGNAPTLGAAAPVLPAWSSAKPSRTEQEAEDAWYAAQLAQSEGIDIERIRAEEADREFARRLASEDAEEHIPGAWS